MIVINELHGGRFGNKVLHYNNLAQIAKNTGHEFNSIPYTEYSLLGLTNDLNSINNYIEIDSKYDMSMLNSKLSFSLKPCLGELFFKYTTPTRSIFKPTTNILSQDVVNVGIHFRGTDFHTWNKDSILDTSYYLNSIKYLHSPNNKYYLFSDDLNLKSFQDVQKYLKQNRYNWELGISTDDMDYHFINDYYQLCDCEYIISSPSTFAICAGFMGKEKEIIHSKKWVDSRVDKNDSFWLGVANGGNNNYKIKTLI